MASAEESPPSSATPYCADCAQQEATQAVEERQTFRRLSSALRGDVRTLQNDVKVLVTQLNELKRVVRSMGSELGELRGIAQELRRAQGGGSSERALSGSGRFELSSSAERQPRGHDAAAAESPRGDAAERLLAALAALPELPERPGSAAAAAAAARTESPSASLLANAEPL